MKLLSTSFLFLIVAFLKGQTVKMDAVTYNLGSNDFENSLPFDVEFKIQGVAPAELKKITLTYKTVNSLKNLSYKGDQGYTAPVTWTNVTGKDPKFSLPVGQLHPNTSYDFRFTVMFSLSLSTEQRAKLNEEMATILRASFNQIDISDSDIDAATSSLESRIKAEAAGNGMVTDISGRTINISATEPPLSAVKNKITNLSGQINRSKLNIENNSATASAYADTLNLANQLFLILNKTNTVTPITQNSLDGVMNPGLPGFEAVKLKEAAQVIIQGLSTSRLRDILEGTAKIDGSAIVASSKRDKASISYLISFFRSINNPAFGNSKNPFFANRASLLVFIGLMENVVKNMNNIDEKTKELEKISTEMPDVVRDLVISKNYNVVDQAAINMEIEKNAYIGLDGGIVYIPAIQGTFISEGVNFYFVPVNKKAPLRSIPWHNRFGKIFSLYLGVTQKAAGPSEENFKPLFEGGSLLYGVGFRFNRVCRLGVGGILFQYKNENPSISKYDLKTSLMVSFSFDIAVLQSLGDFGKILGLIK